MRFNPDFAIDARTETKKAEAVSTKKVQAMLVAWTNFLRKEMSGLLRRIPRAIAKSGLEQSLVIAFLCCCSVLSYAQGRRPPWKTEPIHTVVDGRVRPDFVFVRLDDVPRLSLTDVRRIFGGKIHWKRISRQMVYSFDGHSATFTLDSSTVTIAGKSVFMETPVMPWANTAYISASILNTPEFQSLTASRILWSKDQKTLTVDPAPDISSPRMYSYPLRSRVLVEIGPRVKYRILSQRDNTVTIRLYGARAGEWEKVSVEDGAITSVELSPHARTTDFIVSLSSGVGDPSVFLEESPRAVVVEVHLGGKSDPAPKNPPLLKSTKLPAVPIPEIEVRPSLSKADKDILTLSPIRTIVIDPGHGGKDPGAVGANGTLEKDVNLQLGLALAQLLNKEGRFKVFLTRKDDRFVSLKERSTLANKSKADLFVSIHCNAAFKKDRKGFEVYFLSENASDDEAAATARMENAVIELENLADRTRGKVEELLWSLARNEHMNDSAEIAGFMSSQVGKRLPTENRGVKQAGFYVLRGTSMPAILVESGFLTNPSEETLLRSVRHQNKLVDALYAGLLDFEKRKIQTKISSSTSPKP